MGLLAWPIALGQLLQNLVANALKFRGPDPPLVRLGASGQNGRWVLSVTDNGVGIQPKHAGEIFAPFKRLHSQKKVEGSGIGPARTEGLRNRQLHNGKLLLCPAESSGRYGIASVFA